MALLLGTSSYAQSDKDSTRSQTDSVCFSLEEALEIADTLISRTGDARNLRVEMAKNILIKAQYRELQLAYEKEKELREMSEDKAEYYEYNYNKLYKQRQKERVTNTIRDIGTYIVLFFAGYGIGQL